MMSSSLDSFIATERDRFSARHNNMFVGAFSQISRYREFLELILERYDRVNQALFEHDKVMKEAFSPGNYPVSEQQQKILDEGRNVSVALQLEIESFYLFDKILLDKVARAIEFYFGKVRGCSLDSHDDLSKRMAKYANTKGLTPLPEKLVQLIGQLKRGISDYRDDEIAHEKSPRTIKATMCSHATSSSWIASTRLYPKESDRQVESKPPTEMMKLVDEYMEETTGYLVINRNKAALEPKIQPLKPEA